MLKEISVCNLNLNAFEIFGKEWTLITAGEEDNFNTMTASWGTFGYIWNKNISTIYIRPERHTFNFTEKYDYFSLCFFKSDYKKELSFCGTTSGKNVNKIKETNLSPVFEEKAPYFSQAKLVVICKKIYAQRIAPESFVDTKFIHDWYKSEGLKANYKEILGEDFEKEESNQNLTKIEGFHQMYVGEIVKVLKDE